MTAPNDLSFLPEGYLDSRRRQRATRLGLALLGIVMLGVSGAFFTAERSLVRARSDYGDIASQYDMAASQIQQFEQLRVRQEELSRRARLAASLVEQMPRSAVVAELRKRLPLGVTLMDVSMTSAPAPVIAPPAAKPGAPAPPAAPKSEEPRPMEVRMKLTGAAQTDPQVAEFVEALNGSDYFTDVSLLISQQVKLQGDLVRKFEVEVKLAPKMPEPPPLKPARPGDPASFTSAMEH